jgi:hypothetical protein
VLPRLCLSLALTFIQQGREEAAVKWLLMWAPRRFKNHDIQDWSRHIFSLPDQSGAIYVDGLYAPFLFMKDLPKLQEKEKLKLLEKHVKEKDNTQANATTSKQKKVPKPLRILWPYGLSPCSIEYITDVAERDDIDEARIAPNLGFGVLPCWVCLQCNGSYHNDLALLVSVNEDSVLIFVVPCLPTTITELREKQTYPPRRFLPKTFLEGFPNLVKIERIAKPVEKDVVTFMDYNQQLRSTGKSRMLLGETFTFSKGLLRRDVQLSDCIRTWPSYDELVRFGVFGVLDLFSKNTPERTVFDWISFIPWSQYQGIRSSNRVRFVGAQSTDSALVVKVEDGMAQVWYSADAPGETVAVPLDLLRLDFQMGEVVEIPPSEDVWQPFGCEPRQALWAIDGYSFTDPRPWTTGFIIDVGENTLDVLVGQYDQVSFDH